jgi:CRP-like cAMP-binding protein
MTTTMLTGIWLTAEPVHTKIERLLLDMLAPSVSDPVLRDAEIEEFRRGVKLAAVIPDYLGLRTTGVDGQGDVPLRLVTPKLPHDPWREALIESGGDRPIGFLVNTADAGPVAFVHDVFGRLGDDEKQFVRRYAALAARGEPHERIIAVLDAGVGETLKAARRNVQALDRAVLFSPDGGTRVQLGSMSHTTKDLLREGLDGMAVFVLPSSLYEAKINYGDVEFLVYLNFFLRQKTRTLIVGTAQQRQILHRLLTLTLFGVFDPSTAEPTSFEDLQEAYGVASRETYQFLRMSYELYGARQSADPESRLLGIDDYVEFVTLHGPETVFSTPTARISVMPRGRAVDVSILQPDGRRATKRLEIEPPRQWAAPIANDLRRPIQFASDRPRFGVTPLGTSHGFDHAGDFTCFVVWINGKGILVDPSPEALAYLDQIGIAAVDVPYVFLTHVHSDHDGGLIATLLGGSRTTVIASDPVFRCFAEKAQLVTGHDFEQETLVLHVPANPGTPAEIDIGGEAVRIETRWNLHPIPTNGFKLTFAGVTFGYSGDTQYDPALLEKLLRDGKLSRAHFDDLMYFLWTPDGRPTADFIYHEAGLPPIHTDKDALGPLPASVTDRMCLVHIADRDVPVGFVPGKPRPFATRILLPATPRSREQSLLEPMRQVVYLYDVPAETLETLLRDGVVATHGPEEFVVQKGPVARHEALYFYVVTEGQLSVRDGSRIIATLHKGDTFGEWGISHQRGFRVADVVADRRSQTIQLSEAQYHWLVGKHPAVQERLSKIRRLLPRLQIAQQLAQLKSEAGYATPSVIESMSANQLASLAIFGTVQTYRQGHRIVAEGDETNGFYIVLSGQLTVLMDVDRAVNELTEGEVFGERGLLDAGTRAATVTVVSPDAEVLFVSTDSFHNLLTSVPAFAWGIWETAGHREFVRPRRRRQRPAGSDSAD